MMCLAENCCAEETDCSQHPKCNTVFVCLTDCITGGGTGSDCYAACASAQPGPYEQKLLQCALGACAAICQ